MEQRDIRTAMLLGEDALQKIKNSRIAVFGLGGVGGHATDAIVRAGIGAIDLIDADTVSESNINRQIIATYDTVGKYKTDAFEERIRSINPDCVVRKFTLFYSEDTQKEFDFSKYAYVIDAIDSVSSKISLVTRCHAAGTPIISALGAGNKLDPLAFEVTDIYKTSVCPLARVMRTELRKRGIKSLKVVYSREEARTPIPITDSEEITRPVSGRQTPASISFVPSAMGLIIASEVIKDIIK